MKKILILTVAVLMILTLGVSAQQQGQKGMKGYPGCGEVMHKGGGPGHCGPGKGKGPKMGHLLKMADEIGLTDEQKDKLIAMQETFGEERIDLRADLEKAELQLRTLKMSEATDAEILAAIDKVGRIKTDMQKMRFRHKQAHQDILTDQQVEKLKTLRQERRANNCPLGPQDGSGPNFKGQRRGRI